MTAVLKDPLHVVALFSYGTDGDNCGGGGFTCYTKEELEYLSAQAPYGLSSNQSRLGVQLKFVCAEDDVQ